MPSIEKRQRCYFGYQILGNPDADFSNIKRSAYPISYYFNLIDKKTGNSLLILKHYDMYTEKEVKAGKIYKEVPIKFLYKELEKGNIRPEIGLGFSILSRGAFNITVWKRDCPIVMVNFLYGLENGDIKKAKLLNTGKHGAYCIWEGRIVDFESRAWNRFLNSGRYDKDKSDYLTTFLESGNLSNKF